MRPRSLELFTLDSPGEGRAGEGCAELFAGRALTPDLSMIQIPGSQAKPL